MVAGAFPVLKLGVLAVKQVSKPLVNYFKRRAKSSPVFRTRLCLPIAQWYHWAETTVRMRLMGLGKPQAVQPLNEQMAVDLGAEMLGETITFLIAAAAVGYEVNRGSEKSAKEKEELNDRLARLEARVDFLTFENEKQSAQIRAQEHNYAFLTSPIGKLKATLAGKADAPSESELQDLPSSSSSSSGQGGGGDGPSPSSSPPPSKAPSSPTDETKPPNKSLLRIFQKKSSEEPSAQIGSDGSGRWEMWEDLWEDLIDEAEDWLDELSDIDLDLFD